MAIVRRHRWLQVQNADGASPSSLTYADLANISVLHVVASINPGTGGPALSVPGLAGALAHLGVRSTVASLDYAEFGAPIDVEDVRNICVTPSALGRRFRGWSPALRTAIAEVASQQVDVIHNHGVWMFPGVYARQVASRAGLPLVISPRGMLDEWSLGRSPIRKMVASLAYEHRNLGSSRLLHATSKLEAEALRRYGLNQPIAVIPNGVDLPDDNEVHPRELLELRFPEMRGRRWLLFMGRLDPKKGLDILLDAWRLLHTGFPDWHLVIAGPDLIGLGAALKATISEYALPQNSITFTGMLDGELKRSALANAEIFVLPTRAENFGMAIAEALAFATPVVTTTAAPWAELLAYDCGWWVEPDTAAITSALQSAMSRCAMQLKAQGRRGRQLVSERYSWHLVASSMLSAYRWILSGGAAPMCVRET